MATEIDGYKFVSFTGKAKQPDGTYLLHGRITDDTLDLDGQRVDKKWADTAVQEWYDGQANIRDMHEPCVVGKAKSLTGSGDTGFDITALIVGTEQVKKLDHDLYGGFSIGIKGTRVDRTDKALAIAPNGVINGGKIIEVSIVDVPANPNAKFTLVKAAEIGDSMAPSTVAPPCTECMGVKKTLVDGDWTTCVKCGGSGVGMNDILPGLNSGPDEHGEVGKVLDIYGFRADEVTLKAGDPDCKTCGGKGTINDGNMDCPDCVKKSVEADTYKKDFSDKERSDLADKDQAMPDGSYPIRNGSDLKNAIQAFGRAKNKVATKAWIIRRAKALGMTSELPDSWGMAKKSAMADAMIALSTVNKGAEPGQWTHDPEMLTSIKEGIVACISQELEELCDGEDERWDLQDLMTVLNGFLSWQMHEAFGGETVSPFAQGDDLTMFVSPDTIKAAQADDATEEQKAAPAIELAKALGIDKIASSTEEITKKVDDLVKDLDTVKKMSAPREWALRASQEQQETQVELEAAQRQLNVYKSAQSELTSPTERAAYDAVVHEAQSKVDALTSKIGA